MNDRALLEAAAKRGRHGMNKSPEHQAWVHMRQRCTNSRRKDFKHYGGRGISVCARWIESFTNFYADVGQRPSSAHSLDRWPDVNGNYEPGNVRWATKQEQIDNTRVVLMVTINGDTKSISAWEREMGLPKGMVRSREVRGWTIEEAIITPSTPGQKRVMRVKRDYSQRTRDEHGRYRQEAS